jgi:hypothetical protein
MNHGRNQQGHCGGAAAALLLVAGNRRGEATSCPNAGSQPAGTDDSVSRHGLARPFVRLVEIR